MSDNRLIVTVEATHLALQDLLEKARRTVDTRSRPGERHAVIDAFMAATSRHLAAADEALLSVASHRLSHGADEVKAYLHQARRLEHATALLKAKLYGEVHATYLSWSEVWDQVRRELVQHNELEHALVEELARTIDADESDGLADALLRAEIKAPTRAHPNIPHRGRLGHIARRLWAVADRFWDAAESRVVPQPVGAPKKEHRHDSLIAQYLVADPRFDDHAPLVTHRRRRSRSRS